MRVVVVTTASSCWRDSGIVRHFLGAGGIVKHLWDVGALMACGNNKATRDMVVSMGGLAVKAAVRDAVSTRQALARLAGQNAVSKSPVRWEAAERRDYYVLADGSRAEKPRGLDSKRHVHVAIAVDRDPTVVQVQLKDTPSRPGAFDRKGHRDLVLFLQKPSEARIRAAQEQLRAGLKRSRNG